MADWGSSQGKLEGRNSLGPSFLNLTATNRMRKQGGKEQDGLSLQSAREGTWATQKVKRHARLSTLMTCNWTISLLAQAYVSMVSLSEASALALTITKHLTRKKKPLESQRGLTYI